VGLRELRGNEDFFDLIVNSLDNLIFVIDGNGSILEHNNALLVTLKTTSDRVINIRCGHALRCPNALEPGARCGETHFCSKCTIRSSILEVLEGGRDVKQKPVSKEFQFGRERVRKYFLMSAKATRYREKDVAIVVLSDISELAESRAKLEELAVRDYLTGIYNRRHIFSEVHRCISSAERYQEVFSILMIDLDDFKCINDTLGHQAGDRVLQKVASYLEEEIRETDIVGRYGGEEFLVILPNTKGEEAYRCAERLRGGVADLERDSLKSPTISIGVAQYSLGMSVEGLISKADTLLYKAKNHGKNRCEM
jgi:diguanylate cyclase (GGDEF)-like protein